jgi:hypothetical protein
MKLLKLPLLGLSALLFFGCQKATLQDSTASNLLKAEPLTISAETSSCLGYNVKLDVDQTSKPGYTIFLWTVTNPNPGNGKNGTIQNLSHWDFVPGSCLVDNLADVTEASYLDSKNGWTTILPLTIGQDPAMSNGGFNCPTGDVIKFPYGTSGSAPSQYKIVLKGNWGIGNMFTYFKSGATTGCCSGDLANVGIGCKVEEDKCSFSQGYWFANNTQHPHGTHPWPAPGTVTISGITYSNDEGIAIFNAPLTDAQAAFTQLAAFKISNAYASDQSVQEAMKTIEKWFSNYGGPDTPVKLAPGNLRNQSASEIQHYGNAKAASDVISAWINAHHCQ